MLELMLHHDAVLGLCQLPAHATCPLKWVCKQVILLIGVQVPDNNDCGREAWSPFLRQHVCLEPPRCQG